MTAQQERDVAARLEARLTARAGAPSSAVGERALADAVEGMRAVGAARFGVRRDGPRDAAWGTGGEDACALAPPLARMIDHTALKPETTEAQIDTLCDEARRFCFASVCVNPGYVPRVAERLAGSPVAVCTVVGFPLGATTTAVKAFEAEDAVRAGATEIDMVLAIGWLKSGRHEAVERDIRAVVEASKGRNPPGRNPPGRVGGGGGANGHGRVLVKVILETALLTDEEKVIACVLAQNAGADFVKTSTGFAKGGATPADIALMRRVVGDRLGVKASGGVRTREDADALVASGATRIGASASVAIVGGGGGEGGGY